jgi:hypothetical protein
MADENFGAWALPPDLEALHDAVIEFALGVNGRVDAQFEKEVFRGPLGSKALQRFHRTAIVTHRSVKSLCLAGWTAITPGVMRTLVDILVSVFALGRKPEDAELMGFRYMAHGLIEGMYDQDSEPEKRQRDTALVDVLKANLSTTDIKRADDLILAYQQKIPPYWYWPDIPNPGTAIKQNMNRIWILWHNFCGTSHGADIGSVLFSDNPDSTGINPEENPRRTRSAIVISSRFLLDISYARAQCENVADEDEYKRFVRDYIKPQEGK